EQRRQRRDHRTEDDRGEEADDLLAVRARKAQDPPHERALHPAALHGFGIAAESHHGLVHHGDAPSYRDRLRNPPLDRLRGACPPIPQFARNSSRRSGASSNAMSCRWHRSSSTPTSTPRTSSPPCATWVCSG